MRAIVVGAGAVGLTCALRLAERGARVLVLEAEPLGATPTRCASRAAAGMLAPITESMVESEGAHPRLLELGLASLDIWLDLGARLALSTFPARGSTWVGDSGQIAALAALARDHDRGTDKFADDSIHLPDEAALEPREALVALELALLSYGAEVRRNAAVMKTDGKEIVCADGTRERADVIALATGLGGPDLAPDASALTPAQGQLLEVRSSAIEPGAILRGRDVYAVGRAEDCAVIGASMEPGRADLETDAATLDLLALRAGVLSSGLKDAPRLRAWAGVRPMSADWAPRIGRAGDVIVARGHSRNGWLLAPITAEIVRAYAFGEEMPKLWSEFAP